MVNVLEAEVSMIKKIQEFERIELPFDVTLKTFESEDNSYEPFEAFIATIQDYEVRVPKTVIAQLQVQKKHNKNLKAFCVEATGSGMNTSYTVIPL